jgi:muconolactone delta-isomerase
MIMLTEWKSRPLHPEQMQRMLSVWAKISADLDANPRMKRIGHYQRADASGGLSIYEVPDGSTAESYTYLLPLHEFLDMRVVPLLTIDETMSAIMTVMERYSADPAPV